MPDFTQVSSNPPAPIHHKFGCQFVMMHYNIIDEKLKYYLNFFKQRGSAFRLKPDHLRYFEKVIKLPKDQDKRMSYGPKEILNWRSIQTGYENFLLIYIFY